jgi:hypothetical protein
MTVTVKECYIRVRDTNGNADTCAAASLQQIKEATPGFSGIDKF